MIKITEKQKILAFYTLFFGSIVVCLITPPAISALSLMACILILSGIYSMRHQAHEESLIYNHMTFLIRTFWRFNLYLLYSTFLGLIYLLVMTDYSAFDPCISYAAQNFTSVMMYWGPNEYMKLINQCATPFMRDNTINIVIGGFLIVFPILSYLLNRLILGWSHAIKNTPVQMEKL